MKLLLQNCKSKETKHCFTKETERCMGRICFTWNFLPFCTHTQQMTMQQEDQEEKKGGWRTFSVHFCHTCEKVSCMFQCGNSEMCGEQKPWGNDD